MDFDKEAREIYNKIADSPYNVSASTKLLSEFARRTFLAGQESMRGRAAVMIDAPSQLGDGRLSEYGHSCRRIAHQVRSLPLLEEPNKEVAG